MQDSSLNDFILVKDHVISDEFCDVLKNIFHQNHSKPSGIGTGNVNKETRIADEFNISEYRQFLNIHLELTKITVGIYNEYLSKLPVGYSKHLPINNSELSVESFRIKHYNEGVGFYSEHVDNVGQRMLAVIYYLETVEHGGETEFCNSTIESVKPVKGRVLVFPTTWQYPHKANIPISNDKYIIQGYLNDIRYLT